MALCISGARLCRCGDNTQVYRRPRVRVGQWPAGSIYSSVIDDCTFVNLVESWLRGKTRPTSLAYIVCVSMLIFLRKKCNKLFRMQTSAVSTKPIQCLAGTGRILAMKQLRSRSPHFKSEKDLEYGKGWIKMSAEPSGQFFTVIFMERISSDLCRPSHFKK
jgi:hypothetical protein